jgi:hypothetical protein
VSATNRVRVSFVRAQADGTPPTTPRMRTARITSEALTFAPTYIDSNELRADRMLADPIKVMQEAGGSIPFEVSYPEDGTFVSELYRSAFYDVWTNSPTFDNDGTADSVVTDAGTAADTYAVVSGGAAVQVGHMVQASGFTNAANNKVFRVVSSTGTTIVGSALGLVAETVPPGTARLKVVGAAGAAGDITATPTGLASTALNFTTLGLIPNISWIKIGGTLDADTFAFLVTAGIVARRGAFARVRAVTATALTLDNLPAGWTTDAGAGKTIKIWFGDSIKNGITQTQMVFETGFMDQTVPTYIVNNGMSVNTLDRNLTARQVATGTCAFTGLGGSPSTVSLDTSPDPATTNRVMAAHANVGRLAAGNAPLVSPNWARSLTWQINNNLRSLEDIASAAPVAINPGECTVTGRIETYFGSNAELAKFYDGTPTAISSIMRKDNQAEIWDMPRVTYRGSGNPVVSGKNQDVTLPFDFTASLDTPSNAVIILNRLPYYEE